MEIFVYVALAGIIAFFVKRYISDIAYLVGKNWKLVSFTVMLCFLTTLVMAKQQEFKYDLAFNHFTSSENTDLKETRYQIRQCKNFVQAKTEGRNVAEYQTVSAGFIPLSSVSTWEVCARTFGMNYWKEDTTINGQDGGRLLCDTYARNTYRSGKVDAWCDTVFAPAPEGRQDVGT